MALLFGSVQLGFIYALLALGVYITYRILNVPDLTVEGSFTLGLAVSASLTIADRPVLALAAAALAGALAGISTGLLQTKAGIPPILSGILTMSGLYTVNLWVMNASSNLTLIGHDTLFELLGSGDPRYPKELVKTALPIAFCALVLVLLVWFFRTHLGLCVRATGNNEDMVRASSINVEAMKVIALAIANGCVGLSGAVLAQYQRFADISSGVGIVVVGLASVIIGEAILGRRGIFVGFLSAVVGSILYRFVIAGALQVNLFPAYALKLISTVIVAIAMSVPVLRRKAADYRMRRKAVR